jgi:Tfp pilus assembly protein PilO
MSSISILAYIILAISIGYAFIYSPMGDLTTLMDQKQQYEQSLENVNNIENTKKELLTKFNNIPATDKQDIEIVLPSSFSFVRFISQIDAVASKYGISIGRTTLREMNSSVEQSTEGSQPSKPFNSAIVGFSFDASYDKFNTFMSDLEKSMRILDVKSVKISAKDNGIYSYDVEFETYWLKSS